MLPIEIVAIVFVVGSFVAIGARFTPRDAFGVRRAPEPIDDSIGMYAFRRLRRRSTLTAADIVQPTLEEIEKRLGIVPTSAPAPQAEAQPALAVAGSPAAAVAPVRDPGPIPPGDLLAAMRAAIEKPPPRPRRRVSQAALTAQRGVGGLVAAALVIAAGLGGASLARTPGGGVLEAVGTPGPSPSPVAPSAGPGSSGLDGPAGAASAAPD